MDKHLHIICFTIPFPVDYGGVYDLFYKLPSLQAEGVKIHLHCFEYGRSRQEILEQYCYSVNYYPRKTGFKYLLSHLPYIVLSRQNEELLLNLLEDDYPILMEGIHSTFLLNDERFKNRRKFVRIHNVEYIYYKYLARTASSIFKKLFYWRESILLRKYEHFIATKATAYWGVTHKDVDTYRKEFNCSTIDYLSLYLPTDWEVKSKTGKGCYCLYQGDLSVDSNHKAAMWLLNNVFNDLEIPFVIAGKNPSPELERLAHQQNHTCIVANPDVAQMQDMITMAQIHILPSYNRTGIKLKLINALFNGRHCLVNYETVEGSGTEQICSVFKTAEECKSLIKELFTKTFSKETIDKRKELLTEMFSNKKNAKQQVKWIWG